MFCSLLMVVLSACRKSSEDDYAAQQAVVDDQVIQGYIKEKVTGPVTKDPSGIYYQIQTPGSGAYPTANSVVTVNYTGTFPQDDAVFDSGSGYTTSLNNVIEGWKIGIPRINRGGRILLLIPSRFGYGPQGSGKIAANRVLVFKIDLLSFQ